MILQSPLTSEAIDPTSVRILSSLIV